MQLAKMFFAIIIMGLALWNLWFYNLNPRLTAARLCAEAKHCVKSLFIRENGANRLAFTQDGTRLLAAGPSGAKAWLPAESYRESLVGMSSVRRLAVAADGSYAVANAKGDIQLVDADGSKGLKFSTVHEEVNAGGQHGHMTFAPGFDLLVIPGGREGGLTFWSTRDGRLVSHLPGEVFDGTIWKMASSRLGYLVLAMFDGRLLVLNMQDFHDLREFKPSGDRLSALALSHEGLLAAAGQEGDIYLWDIVSAELLGAFQQEDGYVSAMAFGGETQLFTAHASGQLISWNTQTLEQQSAQQFRRRISDISASPDGQQIAVALSRDAALVERYVPFAGDYRDFDERYSTNRQRRSYVEVYPGAILVLNSPASAE